MSPFQRGREFTADTLGLVLEGRSFDSPNRVVLDRASNSAYDS